MIDWGLVLENSIWLAGLSLIMAVFSLASYRAARQGIVWRSRLLWVSVASSRWTLVGGILFCAGLALTAGSWLEATMWVLLGAAIVIAWAVVKAGIGAETHPAGTESHLSINPEPLAGRYLPVAGWIVRLELLWLVLLSPFYLFPGNGGPSILALAALPLIWVVRRLARGRFVPPTPLDWPILLMMVMLLVSLFVTFDPVLSLGKVTGLLFGVAIYYAIVGLVSDAGKPIRWVLIGYSAAGLLLALVGLLGTDWSFKFNFLANVEARLPTFLRGLPGAENGINPNETAGALLWVLPVQLALVRSTWSPRFRDTRFGTVILVGTIVMAAISGGVLILAESRGALAGLALGILVLLAVFLPRTRAVLVAGGVLVGISIVVALYLGPANIANEVLGSVGTGFGTGDLFRSVQSRAEIWSRALYGIQDFPLTGMGMNTFRILMPALYPSSFPPGIDQAHAHNNMLQVALDLGLPGLVAYTALWLVSIALVVEVWRQSRVDWIRWMAGGIGAGMAAYWLFGLTDTVTLGAKPGLFFWALAALLVAAWQLVQGAIKASAINESAGASIVSLSDEYEPATVEK
jgi:putative inorganic carbon (HCO3(-)) transporter